MQKFVVFVHAKEDEGAKFAHALMYANELKDAGHEVQLVFDGASVKTLANLTADPERPVYKLYQSLTEKDVIQGACEFCSNIMGVQEQLSNTGLSLLSEANGHPSIAEYVAKGFTPIVM